jgi:hypothetical protein
VWELLRASRKINVPIRRGDLSGTAGIVSASILAMILSGAFGGALVALVLASVLTSQVWLAIVTALLAVVISLVVRQVVFGSRTQLDLPPQLYVMHVIVGSFIGGLAGFELAIDLRDSPVSPLIGATSGLLGAVLISYLIVTRSYGRNG